VDAKDLALDDRANAQIIEYVHAVLPRVGVPVLADIFIVKPIDLRNLSGFVVTSQEGDVAWVPDLKTHEKLEGFN
jgi:hypothetical protein